MNFSRPVVTLTAVSLSFPRRQFRRPGNFNGRRFARRSKQRSSEQTRDRHAGVRVVFIIIRPGKSVAAAGGGFHDDSSNPERAPRVRRHEIIPRV